MSSLALEMKNICKSFGGIRALNDVDFTLKKGEIHALIGENGAGKSTLVKILTGVHQMDSGEIVLDNEPVTIHNPIDARKKGIAAIYQEMSLIDSLTVAENIYLGHEPASKYISWVDRGEMFRRAEEELSSFNIEINPRMKVGELGLGKKKIVEIVKALTIGAQLLLLDEPTTGMSGAEIDTFFEIVAELKSNQVTMIYISHHLEEVFRICDRVSVLRDGENAGTFEVANVDLKTLIQSMIGKDLEGIERQRTTAPFDEVLLSVRGFLAEGMKEPISFDLHKNEILGLTGIIGAGKSELGLGLFGYSKKLSGEVVFSGRPVSVRNPCSAFRSSFAFVPEDRKSQGLFLQLPVEHNIMVSNISKALIGPFLSSNNRKRLALDTARRLKIVPLDLKMLAQNLSGGNQQKAVIGKWLVGSPRILILDEPTRGIDVGAKAEIFNLIQNLADEGVGIILLSSEFKEVATICDRAIVLRKGIIKSELRREDISTERLLTLALGGEA
jgi:ABC-type sugar transport system ATPase subunit